MTLTLLFPAGTISVQKTLTPSYNVRQLGTKTLVPTYSVRQLATKTVVPVYDVRQEAGKDLIPTYSIRQLATKTVTPTYNISNLATKTLVPTYNVAQLATKTVSPSYNIATLATKTLTPTYDILSALTVQKTLTPTYTIWNHPTSITLEMTNIHYPLLSNNWVKGFTITTNTPVPPEGGVYIWLVDESADGYWYGGQVIDMDGETEATGVYTLEHNILPSRRFDRTYKFTTGYTRVVPAGEYADWKCWDNTDSIDLNGIIPDNPAAEYERVETTEDITWHLRHEIGGGHYFDVYNLTGGTSWQFFGSVETVANQTAYSITPNWAGLTWSNDDTIVISLREDSDWADWYDVDMMAIGHINNARVTTKTTTRRNLAQNSSFETDSNSDGLADYLASGYTTNSLVSGRTGGNAQRLQRTISGAGTWYSFYEFRTKDWNSGVGASPAFPGDRHTVSFYYKLAQSGSTVTRLYLEYRDANNGIGGGSAILSPTSEWTRASMTTNVAPSGVIRYVFAPYSTGTDDGDTVDLIIDDVLVEVAPSVGSYFSDEEPISYNVFEIAGKTLTPSYTLYNHISSISGITLTSDEDYIWFTPAQEKTLHFHTDVGCPPEGRMQAWIVEPTSNQWYPWEIMPAQNTTDWTVDITAIAWSNFPDRVHNLYVYYDKYSNDTFTTYGQYGSGISFNYITDTNANNTVYHRYTSEAANWTLAHPLNNLNGSFQVFIVDVDVGSPYYVTWYDLGGLHASTQGQTTFSKSDLAWENARLCNNAVSHIYFRPDRNVWGGWWASFSPGAWGDFTTQSAFIYDYKSQTVTPTYDSRQLATKHTAEDFNWAINPNGDGPPTAGWYIGWWENSNWQAAMSQGPKLDGLSGNLSLKMDMTGGDPYYYMYLGNSAEMPAREGMPATFSVYIQGDQPSIADNHLRLHCWDKDRQLISIIYGPQITGISTTQPTRYSVSYSSLPAGTHYVSPMVQFGQIAEDEHIVVYFAEAMLTMTEDVVPFLNGVSYDIRAIASKTVTPVYDMRNLSNKTITPTYAMRQLGTKTITPTYNMRSLANKTVTPTYDIRGKQTKTVTPTYSIYTKGTKTLTPTYNMRSLAGDTLSPVYDIRCLSGTTLTPVYTIRIILRARGLVRTYGTMNIAYKESPRATVSVVEEAAVETPRVQQGGAKVCQ